MNQGPELSDPDLIDRLFSSIFGRDEDIQEAREAKEKADKASRPTERRRAKLELELALEEVRRKDLFYDYMEAWYKYEERYNEGYEEQKQAE